MKHMLRVMTPTNDVLNDIMMLAEKKKPRASRWSVPVLHPFPIERSAPIRGDTLLYMIRGERTTRRIIMSETKPVMTLPNLRLIRSPVKKHDSRWGMYVFPTAQPESVAKTRPVLRAIRRKKPNQISFYAFPFLTTPPPKKAHSQLRLIRQSIREL